MLIKPDINYTVLDQHMEMDISSIWVKISKQGQKKLNDKTMDRSH